MDKIPKEHILELSDSWFSEFPPEEQYRIVKQISEDTYVVEKVEEKSEEHPQHIIDYLKHKPILKREFLKARPGKFKINDNI